MYRGFPAWSWERAGLRYLCSSLPLPPAPVLSSEHELLNIQENPQANPLQISRVLFSVLFSGTLSCELYLPLVSWTCSSISSTQGVYWASWPPHSCTTGQKVSPSHDWGNQRACLICFLSLGDHFPCPFLSPPQPPCVVCYKPLFLFLLISCGRVNMALWWLILAQKTRVIY